MASTADPSACERPSVPGDVDRALNKAETAFADLDIPTFLEHSDDARQQLVCLNVLLPTGIVARMHRVEGLRAFGERSVFAVRAFAAARSLDFAYSFPPELVPSGSPILEDWDAMDLAAGGLEPLPEPAEGKVWIDGVQTLERPDAWPSVVQLLEDDGTPVFSRYLRHDEDPPDYPVEGRPVAAVGSSTVDRTRRERTPLQPRVPLLIGAGATAVATGVMAVIAGTSRATYFDEATPRDDLAGLRSRTNSMAIASTVTGVATVGLGVGVALTW